MEAPATWNVHNWRPLTAAHYGQLVFSLGLNLRVIELRRDRLIVVCPYEGEQRWPVKNFMALVLLHTGADPVFH